MNVSDEIFGMLYPCHCTLLVAFNGLSNVCLYQLKMTEKFYWFLNLPILTPYAHLSIISNTDHVVSVLIL